MHYQFINSSLRGVVMIEPSEIGVIDFEGSLFRYHTIKDFASNMEAIVAYENLKLCKRLVIRMISR